MAFFTFTHPSYRSLSFTLSLSLLFTLSLSLSHTRDQHNLKCKFLYFYFFLGVRGGDISWKHSLELEKRKSSNSMLQEHRADWGELLITVGHSRIPWNFASDNDDPKKQGCVVWVKSYLIYIKIYSPFVYTVYDLLLLFLLYSYTPTLQCKLFSMSIKFTIIIIKFTFI